MRANHLVAVSIILLAQLFLGRTAAVAEIIGDEDLFRLVAKVNRANFQKLRTWQGEVFIKREATIAGKSKSAHSSANFVYDQNSGKYLFLADVTADSKAPVKWGGLITPEGYFQISRNSGFDHDKSQQEFDLIIRKKTGTIFHSFSASFNALRYLRVDNDYDIHDRLMDLLELGKKEGSGVTKISRDNDLVRLDLINGENPNFQSWYIFDLIKGANLIEYGSKGGITDRHGERRFAEISGVWVPEFSSHRTSNAKDNRIDRISVTWKKNLVNEPVKESDFELEKIGITKGSEVRDARTGQTYIYKGAKEDNESSSWFWPALIITSLVLLAMIAVGFGRRMLYNRALKGSS